MADLQHGHCPRCDHRRTLRIPNLAHSRPGAPAPWFLASVPRLTDGFFGSDYALVGVGQVEAFVCARCGLTEFATRNPDQIPVDGEHVQEVLGDDAKDPYR